MDEVSGAGRPDILGESNMRRRVFLLAAAATPFIGGLSFATEPRVIPLDLSRRQPRVRLSINGVDRGEAIFDTGAFGGTIHRPLAEELGLPNNEPVEVTSGAGGEPIQAFMTTVPNAAINGVPVANFSAAALPMVRPDTIAVLSPAMFAGELVVLDFGDGEMRILPKTAETLPSSAPVPYTSGDYPLPGIPLELPGGVSMLAHLDTGSPASIMLPHDLASTLPLSTPLQEVGRARMINTERVIYRATLAGEARVGPLTLTNPQLTFMEGFSHGNIGMELLRQLNITLDPAERRLWLAAHG
jgi:hypothetical protein